MGTPDVFLLLLFVLELSWYLECSNFTYNCYVGSGSNYRGPVNMTATGYPCQLWKSEQSHPDHMYITLYPASGLDDNYCRNPDGEPQPWCLSSNPDRFFEFCDIPVCGETAETTGRTTTTEPPVASTASATSTMSTSQTASTASTASTAPATRETASNTTPSFVTEDITLPVGCYESDGMRYRGGARQTKSGRTCQRWDSQHPHAHLFSTPENLPNAGLDSNFCRNPDGDHMPWCFTTDIYTIWEYCDISICNATATTTTTTTTTAYHGATIPDIDCYVSDGRNYRGKETLTVSGRTCQRWDSQTPHAHLVSTPETEPDAGLEGNYCRNPDGEPKPWCFTTDPSVIWEVCSISQCSAEVSAVTGSTTRVPTSTEAAVSGTSKVTRPVQCIVGDGSTYRGHVNVTRSGWTCQRWDSSFPHRNVLNTPQAKPNAGLESNYCRNPDAEPRPWCFTTDLNHVWDFCDIPVCGGEGSTAATTTPSVATTVTESKTSAVTTPVECYTGDGSTYQGHVTVTRYGWTCQRWDSLPAHSNMDYTPQSKPYAVLESNYCRNPDGKPRPWCFAHSLHIMWDYCDIPVCGVEASISPTTTSTTTTKSMGTTNTVSTMNGVTKPECYTGDGSSYRGTQNRTASNRVCQRWDSQNPHSHQQTVENYPTAGLESNYCRNPDKEPKPWCFTTDHFKVWEFCNVPVCASVSTGVRTSRTTPAISETTTSNLTSTLSTPTAHVQRQIPRTGFLIVNTKMKEEYVYFRLPSRSEHSITFQVQAEADARIALSQDGQDTVPMYVVILGATNNAESVIKRGRHCCYLTPNIKTPELLSADEFRRFKITWQQGTITVWSFKSGNYENFIQATDKNPFVVSHVGFASGWGESARWQIWQESHQSEISGLSRGTLAAIIFSCILLVVVLVGLLAYFSRDRWLTRIKVLHLRGRIPWRLVTFQGDSQEVKLLSEPE